MLPSNTDLTYFLHIAKLGNLTHAAQSLGIAQPSLTLAVQRLETAVGTKVLIRSRKGVRLTKAGEKLFSETRHLLEAWDRLKSKVIQTTNETRGLYRIGCHASVANYSLPLFLPKLIQEHPSLEITLEHDLSRHITQKVLEFQVDVGIVVNPVAHPDLVLKSLAADEVTFWQNPKLPNSEVLICDPNLLQVQTLLQKNKRSGLRFSRRIESSNLEVIASLTASGAGIGILPGRVAQAHGLRLKKVKNAPVFQDQIHLAYRTENRNVRAIQVISKAIQNAFA